MGWDRHLEHWVVTHRVGFLDPVFRWLTYSGMGGAVWLAIGLVLALSRRRVQVFLWVVVADLVAQLTTEAIKAVVSRERPHVHALVSLPNSRSFPSGHASSSFACAAVLAALAPKLRVPLFLLAALIAWSRVYVGVHYPLDVVAGALWGIAVGIVLLKLEPVASAQLEHRRASRRQQSRH